MPMTEDEKAAIIDSLIAAKERIENLEKLIASREIATSLVLQALIMALGKSKAIRTENLADDLSAMANDVRDYPDAVANLRLLARVLRGLP